MRIDVWTKFVWISLGSRFIAFFYKMGMNWLYRRLETLFRLILSKRQMRTRLEVFYSYAHADENLRNKLEQQLSLLHRQGLITGWYDRMIAPGAEWKEQINAHLNNASIILLLVSPDFLASAYSYGVEVKRAMERYEAGEACVIPVILRPALWQKAPFGKLQALPRNARPVTSWRNRDKAFLDIAEGIQKAVEELTAGVPRPRS
jgi:hypothetical protein